MRRDLLELGDLVVGNGIVRLPKMEMVIVCILSIMSIKEVKTMASVWK